MTISVLWWSTSTATVSAATPGSSILAATAPAPPLTFTHPTHNLIRAELHVVGWAVFGYPLAGELQLQIRVRELGRHCHWRSSRCTQIVWVRGVLMPEKIIWSWIVQHNWLIAAFLLSFFLSIYAQSALSRPLERASKKSVMLHCCSVVRYLITNWSLVETKEYMLCLQSGSQVET